LRIIFTSFCRYADASLILPLLVAETFAKDFQPEEGKKKVEEEEAVQAEK